MLSVKTREAEITKIPSLQDFDLQTMLPEVLKNRLRKAASIVTKISE
jgi:hypothetical protein